MEQKNKDKCFLQPSAAKKGMASSLSLCLSQHVSLPSFTKKKKKKGKHVSYIFRSWLGKLAKKPFR